MDDLSDDYGNTFVPITKYEWVKERIEIIEKLYRNGEKTFFKIQVIKKHGFIVIVQGLEAYIYFNNMPWTYNDFESWGTVLPTLYSKKFYCKILEIRYDPFSFTIDANVAQFKRVELIENNEYKGIIIKRELTFLLVDIGYNFNWSCGSIVGVLNKSKFIFSDFDPSYNEGKEITVKYSKVADNGHVRLYKDKDKSFWNDLIVTNLIGLIVDVRYHKDDELYDEFWVKDRYKGMLVFVYDIYGENLDEVKELKHNLENNEVIQCEIISVNTIIGYFNLKWIAPTRAYKLWHSELVEQYLYKVTEVKIIKKELKINLLVDDKYQAYLPLTDAIYYKNLKRIIKQHEKLEDGDVIKCEVLKANIEQGYFILRWLLETEDDINWELLEIEDLKEKVKQAKVIKIDSIIKFVVNDEYDAILTLSKNCYGKDSFAIPKYIQQLDDGEYIDCEIVEIDKKNEKLIINLINYNEAIFWTLRETEKLIDRCTWVRVIKKNGGEVEFFLKDIYKAVMPITPEIYNDNFHKISCCYQLLEDNEIIQCKVTSINIKEAHFIIKWMLPIKKTDYWYSKEVDKLLGKVVIAIVRKTKFNTVFLIDEIYKAVMPVSNLIYAEREKEVMDIFNKFNEGEKIKCMIYDVERELGYFQIKWIFKQK